MSVPNSPCALACIVSTVGGVFFNLHLISRFGLFDPRFRINRLLMLGNFAGADELVAYLHQGFVPICYTCNEGSAVHGLACLE